MDIDGLNLSYEAALIFGAVTIVFRSWENFNRPTDHQRDSLGDLVTLLNPSDMRAQRVYWRAFTFYAGILVLVYLVICAYAGFFAPLLGEQFASLVQDTQDRLGGATVGADALPMSGYDPRLGDAAPQVDLRNPALPLALSLAMVGLAPQIPGLRGFETRLRYAAHWLSGIPTRLVKGAELLSKQTLGLKDLLDRTDKTADGIDNPAIVSRQDWSRLKHYQKRFRDKDVPIDTFELTDRVEMIVAFRSWILQGRLDVRNPYTDFKPHEIEAEITRQADRFLLELDQATGFRANGETDGASAGDAAVWTRLDEEAAALNRKLCIVMMLLVEHGVIEVDEQADRGPFSFPNEKDYATQRQKVIEFLRRRLTFALNQSDWGELSFSVWGRAISSILMLATVFGAVAGFWQLGTNPAEGPDYSFGIGASAFGYLENAAVIYALPLFTALSMRQNRALNNQWENPFSEPWVRWSFQTFEVFFMATLVAVFCAVSQNFAHTISAVGIEVVVQNWSAVLRTALEYQGVLSLVGPTLAISLVFLIDAWDMPHGKSPAERETEAKTLMRINRVILFGCTLGLGLVACVTRILASYVAEAASIRNGFTTGLTPLTELIAMNWQIYLTTTAFAMVIGWVAGVTVRETLLQEFKTGAVRRGRTITIAKRKKLAKTPEPAE